MSRSGVGPLAGCGIAIGKISVTRWQAGWAVAVTATEATVRVHDRENRHAALYCFEGGGERIA